MLDEVDAFDQVVESVVSRPIGDRTVHERIVPAELPVAAIAEQIDRHSGQTDVVLRQSVVGLVDEHGPGNRGQIGC